MWVIHLPAPQRFKSRGEIKGSSHLGILVEAVSPTSAEFILEIMNSMWKPASAGRWRELERINSHRSSPLTCSEGIRLIAADFIYWPVKIFSSCLIDWISWTPVYLYFGVKMSCVWIQAHSVQLGFNDICVFVFSLWLLHWKHFHTCP